MKARPHPDPSRRRTLPKRPRPGSILEIKTPGGLGYLQVVGKDPEYGELIRVFPGSRPHRPSSFEEFVSRNDSYYVFFPAGAAVRRGLVSIVGFEEISPNVPVPPLMRRPGGRTPGGRVLNWFVRSPGGAEEFIEELTPEQAKLPLAVIWNDTLLAERIDERWRPELQR